MQKSQRALHSSSSKDTQNTQQSILMLKSRLKFQLQVNSKFTSGDIFSQVAVSLFTLPSCSQVNFLPRVIRPSVRLRDCTMGNTLENTPGALPGCQSLYLSQTPTHIQFKTPELQSYFGYFCNLGSTDLGPLFPPGLSSLVGQGGGTGEPQLYGKQHSVFLTCFAIVSGLNQTRMATLVILLWAMRKQFLKLEM